MSNELETRNVQEFLKELTKLSRDYGIAIGGCGCCGSPWLYEEEGDDFKNQAYGIDRVKSESLEFDYKYKTRDN